MFKSKASSHHFEHSAKQLPNFNCMSGSLDPKQLECSSTSINPGTFMFTGIPHIPSLKTEQKYESTELLCSIPSNFQTVLPSLRPYLGGPHLKSFSGLCQMPVPSSDDGSFRKGFLIFDRSGNQTRVMYSSSSSLAQVPSNVATKRKGCCFPFEEYAFRDNDLTNYLFHKESSENCVAGEESEMHEDTEEINALLYSDDDNDYRSDDEVTSTGHSPVPIMKDYEKQKEQFEEMDEEIASCDDPRKRLRLLNGGYNKSSPKITASSFKVAEDGIDVELRYGFDKMQRNEIDSGLDSVPSRKDKVRESLRA